MTLHWLSPLAVKAYKASSLSLDDVWGLSCHEASEINFQRWGNCDTAEVCLRKVTWIAQKIIRRWNTVFPENYLRHKKQARKMFVQRWGYTIWGGNYEIPCWPHSLVVNANPTTCCAWKRCSNMHNTLRNMFNRTSEGPISNQSGLTQNSNMNKSFYLTSLTPYAKEKLYAVQISGCRGRYRTRQVMWGYLL